MTLPALLRKNNSGFRWSNLSERNLSKFILTRLKNRSSIVLKVPSNRMNVHSRLLRDQVKGKVRLEFLIKLENFTILKGSIREVLSIKSNIW